MQEDVFLSVKEAAQESRVSVRMIYDWINSGQLRAVKFKRLTKLRRSWLHECIDGLPPYSDETKARSPNTRVAGEGA